METDEIAAREYFTLVDIVKDFDQRLLTIKGWGVTVSLAALGLGFQYQHAGLFLVATVSSIAFWALEASFKSHQVRYYARMRELEVAAYASKRTGIKAPQIDWSWTRAADLYLGKHLSQEAAPQPYGVWRRYRSVWRLANVALPHVITVLTGGILFALSIKGLIAMPL